MTLHLRVEVGPTRAELAQVLDVDLADVADVAESLAPGPLEYFWELPGGGCVRLVAQSIDTPPETHPSTDSPAER